MVIRFKIPFLLSGAVFLLLNKAICTFRINITPKNKHDEMWLFP